jgi:hypothetical protein
MIEFSERESDLFKLRFARATIHSDFDRWDGIKKEISDMDLDYLRLKVANPGSHFISQLSALSPHIFLAGIIRLYKMKVDTGLDKSFNPDVIFKKVTLGEKNFFKRILEATYTDCPLGNHHYPLLEKHFPLHLQIENIGSYFADFFSGQEPGREAYMGYLNGEPVGCFASDFSNPHTVETLYAGILPAHRNKDLFKDMIRYYKKLCHERGKTEAICGARIENLPSQFAMEQEASFCYGHEWVYMIGFK